MKSWYYLLFLLAVLGLTACKKTEDAVNPAEQAVNLSGIGTIDLGGTGAAEISAYDPATKRLFVVNAEAPTSPRIDVVNLEDPARPVLLGQIDLSGVGIANSVAAYNGLLTAAIENPNKQANGQVIVYNTSTLAQVRAITVGALPDMVTFSPNGRYIVTANEGEPNDAYTVDPNGSISIIDVSNNYAVTTVEFGSLAGQQATLVAGGFRIFGFNASFASDIEPEYVAISDDSQTAWVTLQENNGIAKVDLATATITNIFPLGYKDYSLAANALDASDQDTAKRFTARPVRGLYMPDAIAFFVEGNTPHLITANEGDARAYTGYSEESRLGSGSYVLDPTAFPNAATLKMNNILGRLQVTRATGDTDMDGDFDAIYAYGARSFSIWNGNTGALVHDSGNDLEEDMVNKANPLYDDGRSDDKGVEPEAVVVGMIGGRRIAFIGMERADALSLYDITTPNAPFHIKTFYTGDAPEGLLLIPADKSPNGRTLVIASNENDGVVRIFSVR